jgi:hypothetical protein
VEAPRGRAVHSPLSPLSFLLLTRCVRAVLLSPSVY